MKIFLKSVLSLLFVGPVVFGFGAEARAAAPFSESFDTYSKGSLYSQGLWQNNSYAWRVTDQGCYNNTGKCIVSTGLNGDNWKVGTDLAAGEWRLRFKVTGQFTYVSRIFFGSSAQPTGHSEISISSGYGDIVTVSDNRSQILATNLSQNEWHTLVYKWDMTNPTNCTFSVKINDGPHVSSAPSVGSPLNCYDNVFSSHKIGSLNLYNYYVGENALLFDDFGIGPVVAGCISNCDGQATSYVSDDFDLFNIKGWEAPYAPFNMFKLFSPEQGSTGNCHTGNCLVANGESGGLGTVGSTPIMFLESGIGSESGAYTIWARTRIGWRFANVDLGLCVASWSHCLGQNAYHFSDFAPADDTWHQYYFAWRQGTTSVEVCKLQDNINSNHCNWVPTTFALGTQFDGVILTASTYRVDLGDQVWVDDLAEASTTPPTVLQPTCNQNCNSSVMFLPGIMASRLYTNNPTTGEEQLWEPYGDADALQLAMDTNGNSLKAVYTKAGGILDSAYVPSLGNVYKSFISNMNNLRASGEIVDWQPIAYDWRYSPHHIVNSGTKTGAKISYTTTSDSPYIIEELKRLAINSKSGKVTIVAHSNGGLVAKALSMKLGSEASKYIDKIIMVGTPQLGTPETIAALLHGSNTSFPFNNLSEKAARDIAQNMPGAYGLVPSNSYFTYVDDPVVTFDHTVPNWMSRYGSTIHSAELLRTFMTDTTRLKPTFADLQTPQVSNSAIYDAALVSHVGLDNWTVPADIELITIAGWGQNTLAGIKYRTVVTNTCIKRNIIGLCTSTKKGTELTFDPKHVVDGDGTVVVPSAMWANGAESSQYWLNLKTFNSDHTIATLNGRVPFEHKNIFEVSELLSIIKSSLTGKTVNFNIYTSKTAPVSTGSRLHFTLHSPLTLGFKDSLGNYTGSTASTTVFNIPEVEYRRYGEVQWLSVPAELAGELLMQGTAEGSFTLDIEKTLNDMVVSTTSFEGVSSATSSRVTLTVNPDISPTASSTLVIDFNGDGTPDSTLHAKLGEVVFPDVTAPSTTFTLEGTKGLNGWYTSNVQVSLSATDAESGIAQTFFSLNGAATSTGTTTSITAEGIHTLTYYSVDKDGNVEVATSTTIKMDKTAPEAIISGSPITQDLEVVGRDTLSSTTVQKTTSITTVIDQAGNKTVLTFTKTYSGKILTYARLTSIKYGTSAPIALPSSFLYVWDAKNSLMSQTVSVESQFIVQAFYNKQTNKTSITVLKQGIPIKTQSVLGLAIVKLTTNKGTVQYGW